MNDNNLGSNPHDNMTPDSTPTVVGSGRPNKTSPSSTRMLQLLIVVAVLGLASISFYVLHSNTNTTNGHGPVRQPAALATVAPAAVSITKDGFMPSTVSVAVGQAVAWTNTDSALHLVASDPYPTDNTLAGLNSRQTITHASSYSYVFTKAGTYTYHDNLNPSWHGTVLVH